MHGDDYGYSQVEYLSSKDKVLIACRTCDQTFEQTPFGHLRGYGCPHCALENQSSHGEKKWLDSLGIPSLIRHHKISGTRYTSDGYDPETNTVYEYMGDFWHGNPDVYDPNAVNPRTGTTFGELYRKTMQKVRDIEDLGFQVVYVWENDFPIHR